MDLGLQFSYLDTVLFAAASCVIRLNTYRKLNSVMESA